MLVSIDNVHSILQTTESHSVYYDCRCRGATVGERGYMAWMPAYIFCPQST
jgi:hypothetical protein